jgi:Tfp pilus assembly protein PilZ
MSGTANDKRRYPRVQARNVSAHLNVASQSSPCTIQNISAGGLFIQTAEALPVGMPVAVNLARPGWTKVLQLTGRVVWAMAERTAAKKGTVPGMRIKFDPLPADNARQLMVLLTDLGAFDSIPPEVSAELAAAARPSNPHYPIPLTAHAQVYAPPLPAAGSVAPLQLSNLAPSAPAPHTSHPVVLNQAFALPEQEATQPSMPVVSIDGPLLPRHAPPASNVPHAPQPPDDNTMPATMNDGLRISSRQAAAAPPAPVPSAPGSGRTPDSPRLIVQVQGLLMQMGELQQMLEARERELEEMRRQLAAKDTELEKAERERRAAELAVQRLSMQITTARRG